jgi:hypothetical protein
MGRLIKNTQIKTASTAIQLPIGTSAVRPEVPVDGQLRFNTSTNKIEMYFNSVWNNVAKIGSVSIVEDTFTTANATTQYGPMSYSYNSGQEANVIVYVGGVMQVPGTNYQFQGNTYLALNPTNGTSGQTIKVMHNFNSTDAA